MSTNQGEQGHRNQPVMAGELFHEVSSVNTAIADGGVQAFGALFETCVLRARFGGLVTFCQSRIRRLVISVLIIQLFASTGFAMIDATPHASPDGKFLIANIGDTANPSHHFELRRSDGSVIFSFEALPGFDLPSFAADIAWSDRGEFVALSVSTGKYLRDTLVIATTSGKVVQVPGNDSDYQTRPVGWTRRGELIVETKAPYGGKADDESSWAHYQYRRTFRIRDGGSRVECVYTGPAVYPYRAELLRDGYKPLRRPPFS